MCLHGGAVGSKENTCFFFKIDFNIHCPIMNTTYLVVSEKLLHLVVNTSFFNAYIMLAT